MAAPSAPQPLSLFRGTFRLQPSTIGGEAAALAAKVGALAVTASVLWTLRPPNDAARSHEAAQTLENHTAVLTAPDFVEPLALLQSVLGDGQATQEFLWSVFISALSAGVKPSHADLSTLLARIAEHPTNASSSQRVLYTLQVMQSYNQELSPLDLKNVLVACREPTPAVVKSILKVLASPMTHSSLMTAALSLNRIRAAELVFMDALELRIPNITVLAESMVANFVSRGVFGRINTVFDLMVSSNQWTLGHGAKTLASQLLSVGMFDLAEEYLGQLCTVEPNTYELNDSFAMDVLNALPHFGKKTKVYEVLSLWMEDVRLSSELRELCRRNVQKYGASFGGKSIRRTSKRGDVQAVEYFLGSQPFSQPTKDTSLGYNKLLKAASLSGDLYTSRKIFTTMTADSNVPTTTAMSSILHTLFNIKDEDEAKRMYDWQVANKIPINATAFNRRLSVFVQQCGAQAIQPSTIFSIIQTAQSSGQPVTSHTLGLLASVFVQQPENLDSSIEFISSLCTNFPKVPIDAPIYNTFFHACMRHKLYTLIDQLKWHMDTVTHTKPDRTTLVFLFQYLIAKVQMGRRADAAGEVQQAIEDYLTQTRELGMTLSNTDVNNIFRAVATTMDIDISVVLGTWEVLMERGYVPRTNTVLSSLRGLALRGRSLGEVGKLSEMMQLWSLLKKENCRTCERTGEFVVQKLIEAGELDAAEAERMYLAKIGVHIPSS
ncbi:hypothetical protein BDR26DRAFT_916725 [Obelidium mucronatum]|nr:hypothetical protein BDR26DRAFT_916725 [Obelidium mucronatum]